MLSKAFSSEAAVRVDDAAGNPQTLHMSRRLDLPDDLVEDIQRRAVQEGRGLDETAATLLRAALAASTPAPSASMLAERARIADKFLTGEWGVELSGFEEGGAAGRKSAEIRDRTWRP